MMMVGRYLNLFIWFHFSKHAPVCVDLVAFDLCGIFSVCRRAGCGFYYMLFEVRGAESVIRHANFKTGTSRVLLLQA